MRLRSKNILLSILLCLLAIPAIAGKISYDSEENLDVNYYYSPPKEDSFFNLKDDKQKSLSNLKLRNESWQRNDEFVKHWHLGSTGMYTTPESDQHRDVLRTFTRYTERHIKNHLTTKRQSRVNDLLFHKKSQSTKGSEYYFTYSTVLLRGRARLDFHNPYLETYAQYSFSNKDEVILMKNWSDLRLKMSFLYAPFRDLTVIPSERALTDSLLGKISYINYDERRAEIIYSINF